MRGKDQAIDSNIV